QSYIDVRDVARFAVAALERSELAGTDLVLGGPEAMSPLGALHVAEEGTGRTFSVRRVPLAMMQLIAAATRPFSPHLFSIMTMGIEGATKGDQVDMRPLLARIPEPIRLGSVRDYISGACAAPDPRPLEQPV